MIGIGTRIALLVAALAGMGAVQAQVSHLTVGTFNGYDTRNGADGEGGAGQYGYTAGTVIREGGSGVYAGQPYAVEGSGSAKYGTLALSTFVASQSDGHGQPIVRLEELITTNWYDRFTVTSNTLAVGSTVRLVMTTRLDIADFGPIAADWVASSQGAACLNQQGLFPTGACMGPGSTTSSGVIGGFALDGWQLEGGDPGRDYVQLGTFGTGVSYFNFYKDVTVGGIVEMNARFEAYAAQYNPYTYLSGFGGSAFFGSARSWLDTSSLGDVTLTSQSGTDYAALAVEESAVPEPATWGMMILGFGMVGAGLRRRRGTLIGA